MRVFASVGNATQGFARFFRELDGALARLPVPVEGLAQTGHTQVTGSRLKLVGFMSRADFESEIASADVVVLHAGVGSLITAIDAGHVPFVMAREARLGEHVNEHQSEIVRVLETRGLVRAFRSADQLAADLERGTTRGRAPSRVRLDPDVGQLLSEAIRGEVRRVEGWGATLVSWLGALAPRVDGRGRAGK